MWVGVFVFGQCVCACWCVCLHVLGFGVCACAVDAVGGLGVASAVDSMGAVDTVVSGAGVWVVVVVWVVRV